jgi:predicted ABC-type ATPase
MAETTPRVIVLAGCNGAGKTTASRTILAETLGVVTFVNADVIAQGLSGFDPASAALEASRIMLERLHKLAADRSDFAFETTLAARSYAPWLRSLRQMGYFVHLAYFWLNSPDLAVARVAQRVHEGGHNIPEATIRQRYTRSLHNFFSLYCPVASFWEFYDNTIRSQPVLIAQCDAGESELILNASVWEQVKRSYSDE